MVRRIPSNTTDKIEMLGGKGWLRTESGLARDFTSASWSFWVALPEGWHHGLRLENLVMESEIRDQY